MHGLQTMLLSDVAHALRSEVPKFSSDLPSFSGDRSRNGLGPFLEKPIADA